MSRIKLLGYMLGVSALVTMMAAGQFSFIGTAHAADDCAPTPAAVAAIQAVQNNTSLTTSQELNQELALRKSLLSQTISCAEADARSLQTQLNAVSLTGNDVQTIQSQLSSRLDDAANYYELELTKVNGAGITGTEQVAREVLTWRESNYMPLADTVNNFLLWAQNQSLFTTAETRFSQIQRIVSFLTPSTNSGVETAFDNAQSSLHAAEDQNAAAEKALAEMLPPDQSLELIQQSLQSLAATYKQFFDISDTVQNIPATSQ